MMVPDFNCFCLSAAHHTLASKKYGDSCQTRLTENMEDCSLLWLYPIIVPIIVPPQKHAKIIHVWLQIDFHTAIAGLFHINTMGCAIMFHVH